MQLRLLAILCAILGCTCSQLCSESDERTIANCVQPMFTLSEQLAQRRPQLNLITFPLFNFDHGELLDLCDTFKRAFDGCIPTDVHKSCANQQLIQILGSLFGFACTQSSDPAIQSQFSCIRNITKQNPSCVDLISVNGPPPPGQQIVKCQFMPAYYNCMSFDINAQCGATGLTTFENAIRSFGCDVQTLDQQSSTVQRQTSTAAEITMNTNHNDTTTTSGQQAITAANEQQRTTIGSLPFPPATRPQSDNDIVIKPPAFAAPSAPKFLRIGPSAVIPIRKGNAQIDTFGPCLGLTRSAVRACLGPTISQWDNLVGKNADLGKVTFPLFKVGKENLLELCDTYASTFLDCKMEQFLACKDDPPVSFVDGLLGFACGNAQEFIPAYNCLFFALDASKAKCDRFMSAGNTKGPRCQGMEEYFNCTRNTIGTICAQTGLDLMRRTIEYFGCSLK